MSSGESSEAMRGRVEENRYKMWLLTGLDREWFATMLSLVVLVTIVALSFVSPAPMRRVIETSDALWWVFSPMLTAIITAVVLVVTFNQLVLSQELGSLGDQRQRMEEARSFRDDIEPLIEPDTAPADPASFLAAILSAIHTSAQALEAGSDDQQDPIAQFASDLAADVDTLENRLDGASFGTFEVIDIVLDFDYSWWLFTAQRLTEEHPEADDDAVGALDDLVSLLEAFGTAREHFKTLYFQWELVNLSRRILYVAVPALLVAIGMLLYVDAAGVTDSTMGVDHLVWLVAIAVTISLAPFFLLTSYVLRIATVVKRTLAIGPFVLRSSG